MNDNEFESTKTFEIQIQKGGPNNSDFVENWLTRESRSPFLNL